MEIRYVKPYISSLILALYPIVEGVPVILTNGQQATRATKRAAGIYTNITGYLAGQQVRSDDFVFPATAVDDKPTMDHVLDDANELGVDVIEAWTEAFDLIADQFPQTAQQPTNAKSLGPAVYLRPECFVVQMGVNQNKSVTIVVGVYADAGFTKRSAYIELVFADGQSLRNRSANIAEMERKIADERSCLDGTHPNWDNLSDESKAQAVNAANINIPILESQLAQIQSQVVGRLSDLIGGGNAPTQLQLKVNQSVGALITAILSELQETDPNYADFDVASFMESFQIPDVS